MTPDTVPTPVLSLPEQTAPEPDAVVGVVLPAVPIHVYIAILTVIVVVAALYLARAFFVPLLIGVLTSYALRPVVDWLKACYIPRAAGAALVLAVVVGAASWATFALSDDATAMIEGLPEAARKVRMHVSATRETGPTALQKIQEAASELQGAAADAAGEKRPARATPAAATAAAAARQTESGAWLRDYMLTQSAVLFSVAAQTPIVLLLAYFLVASGDHFRRKLVHMVGPTLARQREAVRMLDEIDSQVQRYLLATVASNLLVAIGTWLAFEALGMEYARVWGITAGVLHFVPYLGPVVFAIVSGMAGFVQFGTLTQAFLIAGASLLVATAVGSVFMTWLQSRVARVNAAVLFIALLFLGWLWGIWGLLLGAPLVAIARVICDRVDALKPAGELLGH